MGPISLKYAGENTGTILVNKGIRLGFSFVSTLEQVLCVGPTGTGKTLAVSDKLLKGMPSKYLSHFISFSARTSANQTQDIIDAKLDKRSVQ